MYKVFMFTGAAVTLYSYLKFCIKYTHVCTMNVRYVLTAVYLSMLVLGVSISGIQERLAEKNAMTGRIFTGLTAGLVAAYSICSMLLNFRLELLLY